MDLLQIYSRFMKTIISTFVLVIKFAAPLHMNFDIALVKLGRAVVLDERVNVACLPRRQDPIHPGDICVTAGWGHTDEGQSYICPPTHL